MPTVSKIVTTNITVENSEKRNEAFSSVVKDKPRPANSTIYDKLGYFLTMRMMIAVLMSSCLMALSVTTTNLAGSLVCMVTEDGKNMANSQSVK